MKRTAATALSACLLLGCGDSASVAPLTSPPEIRVVDFAGLEAELESHRGKPLLVNFWAMWCAPCVAELPDLVAVAREFRQHGGVVLAVSRDLLQGGSLGDVQRKLPGFLTRNGIDLPVLLYDDPDPFALQRNLGLDGRIPETLAIDAAGAVVDRHLGRATREQLEQLATAASR